MSALLRIAVLLLLSVAQPGAAKEAPRKGGPGTAAISSAHHQATDAGLEIIASGGNAFDAAVAVSAALSVVEPVSSGIGGGGFFLLHDVRTNRDIFVDARETAVASARPEHYLDAKGELDRDKSVNGPLSAGIPGLPAGLVHVAAKYGRLPLATSLAPAIRLARDGFAVYPRMATSYADRREVMERFEATRKVYLADGDPPEAGETLRQPELAHTLELLAAKGFDGFYRGEIAASLVADVNKHGGDWSAADLSSYAVKEREPIRIRYRDWDIVTAPPPSSSGVVLAEILQVLEGIELGKLDEAHRVHYVVESMRRAYRDRGAHLGDPDFVQMPIARLTSDEYAAVLRAAISPDKATPSATLPASDSADDGGSGNTTHFSIIDADGNLASVTQTVNLAYGSGMVIAGGGFLLNNELDDFALRAGTPNAFGVIGFDANAIAPGRRPLSSMSPTFMLGKERTAVLGGKGGSRIITMVLLGILGLEQGMSPAEIAAMPRYHHQYLPDRIAAEPGSLSPEVASVLQSMGHEVSASPAPWNAFLHAVDWNRRDNTLRGGADPRNPPGSAQVSERQASKQEEEARQ